MRKNKVPSVQQAKELQRLFKQELPDMIHRLERINKSMIKYDHPVLSLVASSLLNEAYDCYLYGRYVPFLIMLSFAFEVLFRAAFDEPKFKDVINCALENRLITSKESQEIHWLRRCRNSITHMIDQQSFTLPKNDTIDFYRGTTDDLAKLTDRGFKLISVINRIQVSGWSIKVYLKSEGKMRSQPSLDDMQKVADYYRAKYSKHSDSAKKKQHKPQTKITRKKS